MSLSPAPDGLSIIRVLPAHPEDVWDAWLDPEALVEWVATRRTVIPLEEIQLDPQVGGHYRYATVNVESGEYAVTGGIFHELAAPQRLAFSWGNHFFYDGWAAALSGLAQYLARTRTDG